MGAPLNRYVQRTHGQIIAIALLYARVLQITVNPPFTGARKMEQGSEQKKDVQDTFGDIKDVQDLDYVTCWYKVAAKYIQGTSIEVCFVSTNSICQGAQVPILWNVLFNDFHVSINFAYQTFRWNSESMDEAAVHCVIVSFATFKRSEKLLFPAGAHPIVVSNISPYLIEGDDSFVVATKDSICGMPKMNFGNQPRDGRHFIVTPEQKREYLENEPEIEKWIHPYIGADEFIYGKERYCFWLVHASPLDISKSKILKQKVEAVRQFRLNSKAKTTNGYAKVPNYFAQITQPEGVNYLIIPSVSTENRKYIPIGFMTPEVISSNAVQIVPNATLYHFGILTSGVHMAWMRLTCGRMKSDYRYSKEIVYNTFPWPTPTEEQLKKIEKTAQAILDARALYPDSNLAILYNEVTMPPELRKAHQANDMAVLAAYGIKKGDPAYGSESACVAFLMKKYQELTEK